MGLSAAAEAQDGAAIGDAYAVVDAFHAALEAGDAKRAQALLADDVTIYEQGYAERSKAEYAAHHLESDIAFSKAVDTETVKRDGAIADGVAYVTGETRTRGTFKGKPVDTFGLETIVLRRTNGAWRIAHIHWSSRKNQ